MTKRTIFSKLAIYIILFLGIILSVSAYFYVEKQSVTSWQNNKINKLNLEVAKIEKDVYLSLMELRTKSLEKLPLSDFLNTTYFTSLAKINLADTLDASNITAQFSDNTNILLTEKLLDVIKVGTMGYQFYFFSLDNNKVYIAFTNDLKSKNPLLYIVKAKPLFNNIKNYNGYAVEISHSTFNQRDGNVIYSSFKYGNSEDFVAHAEYNITNALFKLAVYIKPTGIDGVSSYSLLFMALILIITFVIVCWIFRQNLRLVNLNFQIYNQTKDLKSAYQMFRKIIGDSFDIISVLNKDLKIEYANSSYAKTLNYNPKAIQGLDFIDVLDNKSRDDFIKKVKGFNYNRGALNFEFSMLHVNNKDKIVVEAMVHAIKGDNDEVENYIVHCKDITAKRESLKALISSKRRFKDFADSSADWLWETDDKLRFSFISAGIKTSTGFAVEELMGKKIDHLFYKSTLVLNKLANDRGSIKDIEIKVQSKDKHELWLRISAIPVYSNTNEFVGYRGVGRNITFTKQEQEKMLELATKDYLTGLLNRSAFMHELDATLSLSKRNGIQGALLFIDLDMFKVVNESHGHDAGDQVLLEFSRTLEASLRNTDIIGRIGGDEFAIIMHDISPHEARKKIKQLINKLSRLKVNYNGEEIQVTSSIGVVKYPSEDQEPSHMLTAAGLAMHKAKDMGRNRVFMTDDHFFEDSFSSNARQKIKWLKILRNALDTGSFEMHFQPMIPAKKNETVIFESLLRIRDEDNNLGSPVYFIEAAENFGLAQTLDICVLKRCIKHHKHLLKQNKNCMLSINISGLSLGDEAVLNTLREIVKKDKPQTDKIIIEVTETATMRDEQKAKEFVAELHNLGFKFALDDFGSGYSSFYYLKKLEVDYVKIDGEFVKNLENSVEDRHFVKALADLAKGLNVKIIAEFVENKSHVDILKEMKIDYMQGYYISKPVGDLDKAVKDFDNKSIDDI